MQINGDQTALNTVLKYGQSGKYFLVQSTVQMQMFGKRHLVVPVI